MRLIADYLSGSFTGSSFDLRCARQHDATSSNSCSLALGSSVTTCGDITVFKVDSTTGRLSLVLNSQVSSASGQPLPYFPVPVDPIDVLLSGSYLLTLSGTPATGDSVFPYNYSQSNGQLTISQNGPQPLNINKATAIQGGNGSVYVLDNESITIGGSSIFPPGTSPSQILPYTVGSGGALQAQTRRRGPGRVRRSPTRSSSLRRARLAEWAYVANTGDNSNADPSITRSERHHRIRHRQLRQPPVDAVVGQPVCQPRVGTGVAGPAVHG